VIAAVKRLLFVVDMYASTVLKMLMLALMVSFRVCGTGVLAFMLAP
jgi:hypothetical protein